LNDSLYIAATGMQAQQKNVETIANNLANVNTPGFKRGRVSFDEMVYRHIQGAVPNDAAPIFMGNGVAMASLMKSFAVGELKPGNSALDIAIRGDGFVEVVDAEGVSAFSRGGTFAVDRDGFLTADNGMPLKSSIRVGTEAASIVVDADGRVYVRQDGQGNPVEVGKLDLVRFADTSGLEPAGAGLYRPTQRSGEPMPGEPGEAGFGQFAQGFIEASNVNLAQEMVELMVAQRAYESNAKVIQASDEMLAMSNNLRK